MKKTLFVLLTEIKNTVLRPSFLIFTFGLPIVAFLLLTAFTGASADEQASITNLLAPPQHKAIQGVVDPSGLIATLPSDLPLWEVELIFYPDEEAASAALEAGEIAVYYLIPEDVLETGEYFIITPDFNPLSGDDFERLMDWILTVNLAGDEDLALQVDSPLIEQEVSLAPEQETRDEENPLSFAVPYVVTIFFYGIVFGTASMMLNSISKEKQNRAIEVLLLSVSPRQLLVGKIAALGLVGLLQTGVYIGIGSTLLKISGRSFTAAANFNLPPSLVWWGLLYFLLGYSIYASLMAGAGALAPNTREASQITFILIIPLIVPLFFVSALITDPNGAVAVAISLFPFSAPPAMMARLAATSVPGWQLALSIGLMVGTAYLIVTMVARLFRAQTLLSGQEFKPKVYFRALLGK
jgi:ABC-2 type transport system permease protein